MRNEVLCVLALVQKLGAFVTNGAPCTDERNSGVSSHLTDYEKVTTDPDLIISHCSIHEETPSAKLLVTLVR